MTLHPKPLFTPKEHRMADHIEKGYERKGYPKTKAWAIAWAVVRKKSGKTGKGCGH